MNSSDPTGDQPLKIAVAVVRRGDEYLIGQRRTGRPLAGMWEFPGGKVLSGELPAAAAVRESLEETGLVVRVVGLLKETLYRYEHATVSLSFFDCEPADPGQAPKRPFRWVRAGELSRYTFPPANAELVALLVGPSASRPES